MDHDLKTWPVFFQAKMDLQKPFEIRKNDSNFALGDTLTLREYELHHNRYTGRVFVETVTYLLADHPGLVPGYVVMGTTPVRSFVDHSPPPADRPFSPDPVESKALPSMVANPSQGGRTVVVTVIENNPVAQVVMDELGERHVLTGGQRDITIAAGHTAKLLIQGHAKLLHS